MEAIAPSIRFPAQARCLRLIRDFCREILEEHAEDPGLLRKLILAIDEAVANVIEHAYAESEEEMPTIDLSVDVQPDQIAVRIIDRGIPFDPSGVGAISPFPAAGGSLSAGDLEARPAPARPLREFPTRGFGLHLIRLIMDRIDYQRTAGGENVLVLTKRLRKG